MIYDKSTPLPPSKGDWEPGNGPLNTRTFTYQILVIFQLYGNEMYLGLLHNNTVFFKFEFINDVVCHFMEDYADFNLLLSIYRI